MRFRYFFLLILLLFTFGLFYIIETLFSSTIAKDLWANLFAAIIAVLLIDRIVKASELQKSEPSLRFVKDRIARVCNVLSVSLWAGADWQERLEKGRWVRRYEIFCTTKEWAIQKIETLLDKYGYLLETELRNDIFDLVSILQDYVWLRIEAKAPTRKDFLIHFYMENVASAVINQSIKIIRDHNLLEGSKEKRIWQWKKGEPPAVGFALSDVEDEPPKETVDYLERVVLKTTLDFRDECYRRVQQNKGKKTV